MVIVMVIGIIDSGKGGLAVAKRIKKEEDRIILLMDSAFFPYGVKSKEFLLKRSYFLVSFLIEQQVDVIVIACNTLSIYAYPFLKQCFSIPILGVFDYFLPYLTNEYTLIGTKTTILYAKTHYPVKVYDGTEFIEAIEKKKNITSFLDEVKKIKTKALLLGCTHFLGIPKSAFSVSVLDQIPMIIEDLETIRKKKS